MRLASILERKNKVVLHLKKMRSSSIWKKWGRLPFQKIWGCFHISSSWVKIRCNNENQLPMLPRTALIVIMPDVVWWWWFGLLTDNNTALGWIRLTYVVGKKKLYIVATTFCLQRPRTEHAHPFGAGPYFLLSKSSHNVRMLESPWSYLWKHHGTSARVSINLNFLSLLLPIPRTPFPPPPTNPHGSPDCSDTSMDLYSVGLRELKPLHEQNTTDK